MQVAMQRLDVLLVGEKRLGHESRLAIGAVAAGTAVLLGLAEQALEIAVKWLKAGGWLTVGNAVIFGEHCSGDHRRIPVAMRGDPISERHRPRLLHQQDIAGAGEEAPAAGAVAPREEVGTAQAVLQRPRFQNLDDIALATGPRHVMDGSGDRIGDLAGGFDPPFVRQRWKACRHPADSMMSMFWTAAPEAPLPRLSRTATRLTCSPP